MAQIVTKTVKSSTISDFIHKNITRIVERYNPVKIILFGSHALGRSNADSDVDLLVIMDTDKPTFDISVEISLILEHSFPIDIIVRTPQEIASRLQMGDFFIKNILETGKVLYEQKIEAASLVAK